MDRLGRVRTLILVARVFTLLVLIVCAGYFLIDVIKGGGFVFWGITFLPVLPGTLLVLIFGVPTFLVFGRLNQIQRAVEKGDVARLKALNSLEWALPALIFSGVIPGIMLLVTHRLMEESGRPPAPVPTPLEVTQNALEAIRKLKSLQDSVGVARGEYESRNDSILNPSEVYPSDRVTAAKQPTTPSDTPLQDLTESAKSGRETWRCPKCGHQADAPAGKSRKYKCRNCGSSMSLVPASRQLHDSGNVAAANYDEQEKRSLERSHPSDQPTALHDKPSPDLTKSHEYASETWKCPKCGRQADAPAGKSAKYKCRNCGEPMVLVSVNKP